MTNDFKYEFYTRITRIVFTLLSYCTLSVHYFYRTLSIDFFLLQPTTYHLPPKS